MMMLTSNFAKKVLSFVKRQLSHGPGYNYGLPGKAKSKKRFVSIALPAISGEVIFGLHPVQLALRAKKRKLFYRVFLSENRNKNVHTDDVFSLILRLSNQLEIPRQMVSKDVLNKLAGNRPHQGVCLDCSPLPYPVWTPQDQFPNHSGEKLDKHPIWLYLHKIKDPMNVGAILRTAYLMGVSKVIQPLSHSCSLSPVVSKASAGTMEVVDLMHLSAQTSASDLCQWWKNYGGEVVGTGKGTATERCVELADFTTTRPTLLLLGNEGTGLDAELETVCNKTLWIRHHHSPGIDSLNVSVAAGILLHWLRNSSSGSQR